MPRASKASCRARQVVVVDLQAARERVELGEVDAPLLLPALEQRGQRRGWAVEIEFHGQRSLPPGGRAGTMATQVGPSTIPGALSRPDSGWPMATRAGVACAADLAERSGDARLEPGDAVAPRRALHGSRDDDGIRVTDVWEPRAVQSSRQQIGRSRASSAVASTTCTYLTAAPSPLVAADAERRPSRAPSRCAACSERRAARSSAG